MSIWPTEQCPNCQKEYSYWSLRRSFKCKKCETQLTTVNYTKSILIVFGLWGFVLSPLIWAAMCCGLPAIIADIIGLILFMGFIGPSAIKLEAQNEAL